jgi:hypothetical protein
MKPAKPVVLGPFRGMNNRLPEQAMRSADGDWVRSAVNVDFIAGRLKRRPGYAIAQTGTDVHSLWGDGGETGYYVDGTTLYRIQNGPSDTVTRTAIATLTAGAKVSFDRADDGTVYYGNGIQQGRDDGATHTANWGAHAATSGTPSEFSRAMPLGTIVRIYRGNRLLTVRGNVLYASDPWKFNLYNPLDGAIPFLEAPLVVVPLESGVFVATAKHTYWLAGDLVAEGNMRQVLAYGALARSDRLIPHSKPKAAVWMTPRGLVRGTDDGDVSNLQEAAVSVSKGDAGATLYREHDGARRAIASVSNVEETVTAATSWMEAEIIRKGITL